MAQGPGVVPADRIHIFLEIGRQAFMQGGFFAHLLDGTANPVHIIDRGLDVVGLHPFQEIRPFLGKALAKGENRFEAGAGLHGKFGQKRIRIAVEVAEKGQGRLPGAGRDPEGFDFAGRRGFDDDKPRKMQAIEPPEGHQPVVGVGLAGIVGHRGQQLAQGRNLTVTDNGDDHEGGLGGHGFRPVRLADCV